MFENLPSSGDSDFKMMVEIRDNQGDRREIRERDSRSEGDDGTERDGTSGRDGMSEGDRNERDGRSEREIRHKGSKTVGGNRSEIRDSKRGMNEVQDNQGDKIERNFIGGCDGVGDGQWSACGDTGLVTLTDKALARLINADPIDKWYQLDPHPIARGQFAVVYHCIHRVTGEEFAAKFSSRWRFGTDCTADILHEVAVCAMLRQTQRTVQLRDVFSSDTEMVLVMEYARGGDLQSLLDQDMVPYESDVISFTRQLLEGLVFIHHLNLVHLDIKPQNLVLMGDFPDCAVKLCDFEISRVLTPGREVREILGTPDYVAPEILQYEPITKKTDMWSVGVLTYVLLTGFLPFGGDTDQETFQQISSGELDFPEELFEDVSEEAIDFMKRLLVRQPECRMSAQECLNHAWMKKEVTRPTPPSILTLPDTNVTMPTLLPTTISTPAYVPTTTANSPAYVPTAATNTQAFVPTTTTNTPTFIPTSSIANTSTYLPPTTTTQAYVPTTTADTKAYVPTSTTSPAYVLTTTPTPAFVPTTTPTSAFIPPTTPTPTYVPSTPTYVPAITPTPTYVPTPATQTPVLPDIQSPTVDIGRPPFHPHPPIRHTPSLPDPSSFSNLTSPITFMPPLPFLQRQESRNLSRHNLDRIRSMSKSREVLSERIQMSNLKKTISKSRERLFDARFSPSKSRERLMGLRSFSQSVEALTALSQLKQENAVYQSCNNIFLPVVNPGDKENDFTCRMYRSLASIDQIDKMSDCSHKMGYFTSRLSKDSEDYNDLVTRHNTNLNTLIAVHDTNKIGNYSNEARLRGGRGGRGSMVCDKRCPRHNHKQPQAQPTQKIPKVNRAEKMKRETQRRRRERREKEKEEKEKQEKHEKAKQKTHLSIEASIEGSPQSGTKLTHEGNTEGSSSPSNRHRSASHVEQRLAERQERQQERQERQEQMERTGRRSSITNRRRNSMDLDRSPVTERLRPGKGTLSSLDERTRSTTPTRKPKSRKNSNVGSDVSQASSQEIVDGILDNPRTPANPNKPTSLDLPEIKILPDDFSQSVESTEKKAKQDSQCVDKDEAYVSLDVPCMNIKTQTASDLLEIQNAMAAKDLVKKNEDGTRESSIGLEEVSQKSHIIDSNHLSISAIREAGEGLKANLKETSDGDQTVSGDVAIILEEDRDSKLKEMKNYLHSISTTSDVGSMLSEGSEGSEPRSQSPGTDTDLPLDWQHQNGTISLNTPSLKPRRRARSSSMIHQPPQLQQQPQPQSPQLHLPQSPQPQSPQPQPSPSAVDHARPWGTLCDGVVARALEKFNIRHDDSKPVGRSRRVSSPAFSPSFSPSSEEFRFPFHS